MAFDASIRTTIPPRSQQSHLQTIVDSLHVANPRDKTDMFGVFRCVAESFPRRGLMVLVSDLLADDAATLRGLRLLRQRGHVVLVFHLLDDDELDFPFAGPTRFDGLETSDFLNCNPRALREGYLEALNSFLERVRRGCARNAIGYTLIRTSQPLDAALATFLSNRVGMHHKN